MTNNLPKYPTSRTDWISTVALQIIYSIQKLHNTSNNDTIATTASSTTKSHNPVSIDVSRVNKNNIANLFCFDSTITFVSNNPSDILDEIFYYESLCK